jgi:hypothetical protein
MNSTHAERTDLTFLQLPCAQSFGDVINFRVRWQTVVETVSGHASQKLRLELAHSVSESLFTSTHGNNNNDRYLNLVRTSHLPVSA